MSSSVMIAAWPPLSRTASRAQLDEARRRGDQCCAGIATGPRAPGPRAPRRARRNRPDGHGGWGPRRAQRSTAAAPPLPDELRRNRDRGLFGRPRAQIEADRGVQPGQLGRSQSPLPQLVQPVLVGATGAHRADVGDRQPERELEQRHVELGVVGEHGERRCARRPRCWPGTGAAIRRPPHRRPETVVPSRTSARASHTVTR